MAEKCDVCYLDHARGHGEYSPQYGFGWTNAVVVALQWLRSTGADAAV
jgi:neutral trehalase